MGLALKVALRFLKSNKSQTFLIVLGIAIGISVQVFVGVLIQSLQTSLVDATIGNSSHITIISDEDNSQIQEWNDILDDLEDFDNLKVVSIAADANAFTNISDKTTAILLRGFEIKDANEIYEINSSIIKGTLPEEEKEVIIGKEFGERFNIGVNDTFYVKTASGIDEKVKICGIYDLNVKALNELWVITTVNNTQDIFEYGYNITSIEIQLQEDYVFEADEIAKEIKTAINNNNTIVQNWKDQNAQLLSGLQGQSISSLFIQVFVVISVVIAISSILAITVLQKSKQLGILKAMGINNKDASKIFLYEGLFFGIAGGIGGILLGLFLLIGFQFGTGGSVIQISIDYNFLIISAIIAVVSCIFASLSPAIKSSRLDPIEIIRGD